MTQANKTALAATPAIGGEALDRETIQTLLDLLNPVHGALDYQIHINSEGEHVYDAPPDYEHHVIVLAQQERDLTQAVLILENRLAAPSASPLREREWHQEPSDDEKIDRAEEALSKSDGEIKA